MTVPAVAFLLARTARQILPTACEPAAAGPAAICPGAGSGLPAGVWLGPVDIPIVAIWLPRRPGARVEQRGRDVREQDRDEHCDGDEQEERLGQREVLALHG